MPDGFWHSSRSFSSMHSKYFNIGFELEKPDPLPLVSHSQLVEMLVGVTLLEYSQSNWRSNDGSFPDSCLITAVPLIISSIAMRRMIEMEKRFILGSASSYVRKRRYANSAQVGWCWRWNCEQVLIISSFIVNVRSRCEKIWHFKSPLTDAL